jgi:hypothetical protein
VNRRRHRHFRPLPATTSPSIAPPPGLHSPRRHLPCVAGELAVLRRPSALSLSSCTAPAPCVSPRRRRTWTPACLQ